MKKSIYTRSRRCWSRNVRRVGDGGLSRRGRYFSTVDLATSIPSFASSATILGEPHVGLAFHIRPMSSPSSGEIGGRPGPPNRLRASQYSRNRFFCQTATVRGWTKNSAARQPDHRLDMTDQSRRSVGRIRGLCPDFRYSDNWCLSAAFSACNDNRDRADVVTKIRMNWINRIMDCRNGHHPGLCNKINRLPFLGPTGVRGRRLAHLFVLPTLTATRQACSLKFVHCPVSPRAPQKFSAMSSRHRCQ